MKTVSPVTTKGCTGLRRRAGAVYAGWMERFTWLVTSRLSTHEALPPTTYCGPSSGACVVETGSLDMYRLLTTASGL